MALSDGAAKDDAAVSQLCHRIGKQFREIEDDGMEDEGRRQQQHAAVEHRAGHRARRRAARARSDGACQRLRQRQTGVGHRAPPWGGRPFDPQPGRLGARGASAEHRASAQSVRGGAALRHCRLPQQLRVAVGRGGGAAQCHAYHRGQGVGALLGSGVAPRRCRVSTRRPRATLSSAGVSAQQQQRQWRCRRRPGCAWAIRAAGAGGDATRRATASVVPRGLHRGHRSALAPQSGAVVRGERAAVRTAGDLRGRLHSTGGETGGARASGVAPSISPFSVRLSRGGGGRRRWQCQRLGGRAGSAAPRRSGNRHNECCRSASPSADNAPVNHRTSITSGDAHFVGLRTSQRDTADVPTHHAVRWHCR
eukprot:ctg_2071.g426